MVGSILSPKCLLPTTKNMFFGSCSGKVQVDVTQAAQVSSDPTWACRKTVFFLVGGNQAGYSSKHASDETHFSPSWWFVLVPHIDDLFHTGSSQTDNPNHRLTQVVQGFISSEEIISSFCFHYIILHYLYYMIKM